MNINVNSPDKAFWFSFCGFRYDFKISLRDSVMERVKTGEVITNDVALKIFKQIKLKADVLSFFMKPVVFIPLSIVVMITGFAIPATGIISFIIEIALCALGGGMVGLSVREPFNGHFLSQLSEAYSEQSRQADAYIHDLQGMDRNLRYTIT